MNPELLPSHRWCTVEKRTRLSPPSIRGEILRHENIQDGFTLTGTPAPARDKMLFKAHTDRRQLLISVAVYDTAGPASRMPPAPLPNRHSVEIFFAPWNDKLGWYQFCFLPDGSVRTFNHLPYPETASTAMPRLKVARFQWIADLDRAVSRLYWLHAWFPLKEVFRAGDICGFNVAGDSPALEETSSWNHSAAVGVQDATCFGTLALRPPRRSEIKLLPIRHPTPKQAREFKFSVTYDIPDNISYANYYSPARLERELATWQSYGINRINWIEYGPVSEWPSLYSPAFWQMSAERKKRFLRNVALTRRYCDDTLRHAVKAAKRLGMEIVAVFKPFDLAFNTALAEDDGRSSVKDVDLRFKAAHPDIAAHPEFTMRAHPDWLRRPVFPITRLRFWSETPIQSFAASRLSLWTSADNVRYTKYRRGFRHRTGHAHRPHYRWSPAGKVVENGRARNWFIELTGLDLRTPFVAVEIGGKSFPVSHRMFAFAEAWSADGSEAPVELASGGSREQGYSFNRCWPGWANHTEPIFDTYTWRGPDLGLRFGDAGNLVTLFEPTFAGARQIWLDHIQQMLDTGVDGVDVRTIGHHNGTESYLRFAFAEPVRAEFHRRHGREVEPTDADYARVRHIRGEAYTQFIRDARSLTNRFGKKLAAHVEWGTEIPAHLHTRLQMQMTLEWERWIRERLVDEVSLRGWGCYNRHVQTKVLPLARKHGVGVHIISKCLPGGLDIRAMEICQRYVTEACAAGFAGFSLYEANDLLRMNAEGIPTPIGLVDEAVRKARHALDHLECDGAG